MPSLCAFPHNRPESYTPMTRTFLAHAVLPSVIALHVAAQLANPVSVGTTTGTIAGVTRTADGNPLPQTAVIAHNRADGGADRFTVSNSEGRYELLDVPPGEYEVKALKSGYRTASRPAVLVAAAQNPRWIRPLRPKSPSEHPSHRRFRRRLPPHRLLMRKQAKLQL